MGGRGTSRGAVSWGGPPGRGGQGHLCAGGRHGSGQGCEQTRFPGRGCRPDDSGDRSGWGGDSALDDLPTVGDTMRRSFSPHEAAALLCKSKTGQRVFRLRTRTLSSERGAHSRGYNTGTPLSTPSSTPGPQTPGAAAPAGGLWTQTLGQAPRLRRGGPGRTPGGRFRHAPRGRWLCWPALRHAAPDPGDLECVPLLCGSF